MANQSNANQGIQIVNFLKHKNYFIIGSTGFTGKVFIEKLLREVPEVQKIYLLLRAKNAEAAAQRLKTEIIDCEVFIRLRNEHGERYEEFMKDKLVAVVGNITGHPCLGMDADLAGVIASQIDVIVNVAADTRWHARYDVLLDVNVRGVSRLLAFAMNCKKLLLLLHVSTDLSMRSHGQPPYRSKHITAPTTMLLRFAKNCCCFVVAGRRSFVGVVVTSDCWTKRA